MPTIEEIRARIAQDMRARGVAAVARELRLNRETAMSFALGCEAEGTRALVLRAVAERRIY